MKEYSDFKDLREAEDYYLPFLKKSGPLKDRAEALYNLGVLYCTNSKRSVAEGMLTESAKICRALAEEDPDFFMPRVALALNEVAYVFIVEEKYKHAADALTEALSIRRKLAETDPECLANVAETLSKQGLLFLTINDHLRAEMVYTEAFNILTKLSENDPDKYLDDLANVYNNMGNVNFANRKLDKAEEFYKKHVQLSRRLVEINPQKYLPNVAQCLYVLGLTAIELKDAGKALKYFQESLEIKRRLAENNPQKYSAGVGELLVFIAGYYQQVSPDKSLSVKCAEEAVALLEPYCGDENMKNCRDVALDILERWKGK